MPLRAEAFAKTNRFLRVRGERADGYHELETVFQSIDLTDEIEVSGADAIELHCDDPALPAGPANLVHRAASRLAEESGTRSGARIRLTKRIPSGAGLGGGSSDAAIALVLLSRLWQLGAGPAELSRIAADIGSDVPFFLVGGTAKGTGRGEILSPLPDEPDRRLVVVVPPFPISTASVYARWKIGESRAAGIGYFGTNDLASAVLQTEPEMARYLEIVAKSFPDCQISGSGSSIAAAVPEDSESGLDRVKEALPDAKVFLSRTVARAEYRRRAGIGAFDPPGEA
jgi:4-diphosphocytidyl-2C-methyl-D-erythritol kinase